MIGPKRKMGRPFASPEKKRAAPISVRFSAEERRILDEVAKRTGATVSDWIRTVVLMAAGIHVETPVAVDMKP